MKGMKIIAIATAITIVTMVACAFAMPTTAEEIIPHNGYYPRLTIVVDVERIGDSDLWIVECEDFSGNHWAFYSEDGEWCEGDLANLLMKRVTEREEDDEIVEVYYEGTFEIKELIDLLMKA